MNYSPPVTPVSLDRLADRMDYAIVGPTDGRMRVGNARLQPFASICHIQRDFGDGLLPGCSGFLIARRVVLTAGHCLYSRWRPVRSPRRIMITAGRNGSHSYIGRAFAQAWYADSRYIEDGLSQFDYGVIVLPEPIPRVPPRLPPGGPQ